MFTDNGGEYQALIPLFQSMGISHYTTPPHTPEQNGIVERRHRHIVETGLALLHFAGLPLSFWSHAFQTAVHLINRLPTPILNSKSPFNVLYGRAPNYTKLKPFGCLCYPWFRPYSQSKLHPRSVPCLFLGYFAAKSAYKCYHTATRRLYLSRHVKFIKNQFPYKESSTSYLSLSTVDEFFTLTPSTSAPPHTPPAITPPISTPALILLDTSSPPPSLPDTSTTKPASLTTSEPTLGSPSSPIPQQSSPPSLPSPSSLSTPSSTRLTRQRKPNSKYFNPAFVNTTTVHPIPTALWRQAS